ncbi:hypothetical protein DPMN_145661 [Dreissena polymorpha]|uniref:Uncharacterized protein n=1 Tax=Dreissena polymorpha TaxID=45954 RepID=A0A9D4IZ16_DREPO|nr:hypothetical protein DPMN_145661 [Dreissena polymorpha]
MMASRLMHSTIAAASKKTTSSPLPFSASSLLSCCGTPLKLSPMVKPTLGQTAVCLTFLTAGKKQSKRDDDQGHDDCR